MVDLLLLGQGRTADVYEYEEGKVLKLFKEDLDSSSIQAEYAVSCLVYQFGISTPKPIEIIELDGRVGIVYERVWGVTILHLMKSKPWLIYPLSRKLAELHVELHKLVAEGMQSQKEMIEHQIREAPYLLDDEKTKIIQQMDHLSYSNRICHGDFHPDNVIIDHNRDCSVIDWMTGMSGNPAGDVARTILLLKLGTLPDGTPWVYKVLFAGIRKIIVRTYTAQYLMKSDISRGEIDRWTLPVAAARLVEWIPEEEKQRLLTVVRDQLI